MTTKIGRTARISHTEFGSGLAVVLVTETEPFWRVVLRELPTASPSALIESVTGLFMAVESVLNVRVAIVKAEA